MEKQQGRNYWNQNQSIGQQYENNLQILNKSNYQIVQEQNSHEKNYFNFERAQHPSEPHSSSPYDQQLTGCMTQGSSRRKNLAEKFQLSHKQQMTLGLKIISGLEKNIVSLPFRQPVDVVGLDIPDYLEIIKQPMDLRTIKRKLSEDIYLNLNQIYSDIELIISNSVKYNELNPDFMRLTRNFQKSYNKIKRDCERQIRKLKNAAEKNIQLTQNQNVGKKVYKSLETNETLNEIQIQSSYDFQELARIAKRIRKLLPNQQIELFKRIGIQNTLTIDIKNLSTKQVKILTKQLQKFETAKKQLVMNEQKKQNSHMTTCQSEFKARA